jgi:hypothetical protein
MQIFRPDSDIGRNRLCGSLCERYLTEITVCSTETPSKSNAVPSRRKRGSAVLSGRVQSELEVVP